MTRKYLFADESGNFDFRDHERYQGASRYFAVGTITVVGDDAISALESDVHELQRKLAWNGVTHDDGFHASEDMQAVRDAMFDVLARHRFIVDVTLLEKSKAQPRLYRDDETFYQYAWFYHFKYVAAHRFRRGDELMAAAASLGSKRKRRAFKGAVESVVNQCLDYEIPRQVAFWPVEAHPALQVADYCLWAVNRSWERGDARAINQLGDKVKSQYNLFGPGTVHYYGPKAELAYGA